MVCGKKLDVVSLSRMTRDNNVDSQRSDKDGHLAMVGGRPVNERNRYLGPKDCQSQGLKATIMGVRRQDSKACCFTNCDAIVRVKGDRCVTQRNRKE